MVEVVAKVVTFHVHLNGGPPSTCDREGVTTSYGINADSCILLYLIVDSCTWGE